MAYPLTMPSRKRLLGLSILAASIGFFSLLVGFVALFGHRYTVGLVFGYGQPYPKAMVVMSAWYLVLGCFASAGLLAIIWRRAGPRLRVVAAVAGPTVAWAVLAAWLTSFVFYGFQAWPTDAPPTRLRWLLDGPPIQMWRAIARWLLGFAGLIGPVEPSTVRGGGTLPDPLVLVMGVVNESMLAVLVTMGLLLLIQQVSMTVRRWRRTA